MALPFWHTFCVFSLSQGEMAKIGDKDSLHIRSNMKMAPQLLLSQVDRAEDDRIIRAMAALTGPVQIEICSQSQTPKHKTTRYRALVTPTHYGCNCPDWQDRSHASWLCRHLVAATLIIQAEHHAIENKEVA
jgi:hypothetical protein